LGGIDVISKKAYLSMIVLFGASILSLHAIQAEDSAGIWKGKMHIPNFGPYEMTMVLEKTDSGYEGTVSRYDGVCRGRYTNAKLTSRKQPAELLVRNDG
jgi:hypothetical protein